MHGGVITITPMQHSSWELLRPLWVVWRGRGGRGASESSGWHDSRTVQLYTIKQHTPWRHFGPMSYSHVACLLALSEAAHRLKHPPKAQIS